MNSKFILFSAAVLLSAQAFAQSFVSTGSTKMVLVEENTGAWCGYCPDGHSILEGLVKNDPKIVPVAIHDHTQFGWPLDGDALQIPEGDSFCMRQGAILGKSTPYSHADSAFTYTKNSYPSACIDRVLLQQNRGAWGSGVGTQEGQTAKVEVTMTHTVSGSTVTVTIMGKVLAALTGSTRVNVYITEDSVEAKGPQASGVYQHSYLYNDATSEWKNKGTVITAGSNWGLTSAGEGYWHMHVLRAMLGGTFGLAGIIPDNAATGTTFSKTFTYTIPTDVKAKNIKLVGLAQQFTAGDLTQRQVYNSVSAKYSATANVSEVGNSIADLKVYPNPATNVLNISANLNNTQDTRITMTNSIGQVVYNNTITKNGTSVNESIDLNSMSNGLYLVTVTNNGQTVTQKVAVSK